jgi:hypothetical protein
MRILAFALALVFAATNAAAVTLPGDPPLKDNITARIIPINGIGDELVYPSPEDLYIFQVEIYQNVSGVWQRVSIDATLRAFTFDPLLGEQDRVSVPFHSDTNGGVVVTFPRSAIHPGGLVDPPTPFDLFVTFSQLGGSPVPTSHHSTLKNLLITTGHFDEADQLDYHHGVNPIGM